MQTPLKCLLAVALLAIGVTSATAGESKLMPEGASLGAAFGTSVAVKGELLAIGAPGDRGGSVHVYAADGRYWRLTPNEPPIISSFGRAVAADGNLIVVGAPSEGAGAFYIFTEPWPVAPPGNGGGGKPPNEGDGPPPGEGPPANPGRS